MTRLFQKQHAVLHHRVCGAIPPQPCKLGPTWSCPTISHGSLIILRQVKTPGQPDPPSCGCPGGFMAAINSGPISGSPVGAFAACSGSVATGCDRSSRSACALASSSLAYWRSALRAWSSNRRWAWPRACLALADRALISSPSPDTQRPAKIQSDKNVRDRTKFTTMSN